MERQQIGSTRKERNTKQGGVVLVDNVTEKAMVHKGFVPMDLLLVMNFNRIYYLTESFPPSFYFLFILMPVLFPSIITILVAYLRLERKEKMNCDISEIKPRKGCSFPCVFMF